MVGPRVGEIYYGQLVINVKEEVEDVIGEQIRIRKLIAFQGGVSMREDFYKPKQHIEEERKEPEAGFGKSNATIDTTYTSSTCASSNTRDTKNNKNRHKHKRKPHDKHDIKRLVQERADRDSQRLHRIQILQEEKQKKEKKIEQAKEEFDKLLFTDSGWGDACLDDFIENDNFRPLFSTQHRRPKKPSTNNNSRGRSPGAIDLRRRLVMADNEEKIMLSRGGQETNRHQTSLRKSRKSDSFERNKQESHNDNKLEIPAASMTPVSTTPKQRRSRSPRRSLSPGLLRRFVRSKDEFGEKCEHKGNQSLSENMFPCRRAALSKTAKRELKECTSTSAKSITKGRSNSPRRSKSPGKLHKNRRSLLANSKYNGEKLEEGGSFRRSLRNLFSSHNDSLPVSPLRVCRQGGRRKLAVEKDKCGDNAGNALIKKQPPSLRNGFITETNASLDPPKRVVRQGSRRKIDVETDNQGACPSQPPQGTFPLRRGNKKNACSNTRSIRPHKSFSSVSSLQKARFSSPIGRNKSSPGHVQRMAKLFQH